MKPMEAFSQEPTPLQPEYSSEGLSGSDPLGREWEPERFTFQVGTSLQMVEELRPVWKTWTHGLDTEIDYYLHNLRNDPTILHPYVLLVSLDGIAQAMLVGQVTKRKMSTFISFVHVRGPEARVLEIINGGRLGRPSSAIDKMLALQLFRVIESGEVDLLCLQRLPLQSELLQEIQKLSGFLMKRIPHIFCYSSVSLTAPLGETPPALAGKVRREVRRKAGILQRAFPSKVRFQCFAHPGGVDVGIRDASAVAITTWQHYLGCGLLSTPQIAESLRFCASKGWLRVYVLYVEDIPCSFLIGQLYNNTFYCQHAGYNPDFARFSVGSLLTAWALDDLATSGVQQVDLGEGGQEHNRRLGCQLCREGTVHVYSRTLRGFWASMFFSLTYIVRVGGRKTLAGLRLNWVLRIWQQFLISRWKCQRLSSEHPAQVSQVL
jgi:hypothetical protein